MGKATGVFLVLAGLGTAALVLPSVDRGAEKQLADVVRIAMGNTEPQSAATPVMGPAPALRAPATTAAIATVRNAQPTSVSVVTTVAPPTVTQAAPSSASTLTTGTTNRPATPVTNPVLVVAPTPVRPESAASAQSPDLTRVIQKELKRVGCYDGEVSGDWNPATKKAMRAFIDRVNATLPVDQPDHILKMLVQGHPGNACGATCPTGQKITDNGRCLPSAILAQKPTLQPRRRDVASNEQTSLKPVQQAAVQPAQAQKVDDVKAAIAKPVTTAASSWSTTTATTAPNAAPLPGRMAIGGPRDNGDIKPMPSGSLASPERAPAPVAQKPGPQKLAKAVIDGEDETASAADAVKKQDIKKPEPRAVERTVRVKRPTPSVSVYRAPPPVRYAAPSYAAPTRRFGPHIFTDQRWAR